MICGGLQIGGFCLGVDAPYDVHLNKSEVDHNLWGCSITVEVSRKLQIVAWTVQSVRVSKGCGIIWLPRLAFI